MESCSLLLLLGAAGQGELGRPHQGCELGAGAILCLESPLLKTLPWIFHRLQAGLQPAESSRKSCEGSSVRVFGKLPCREEGNCRNEEEKPPEPVMLLSALQPQGPVT